MSVSLRLGGTYLRRPAFGWSGGNSTGVGDGRSLPRLSLVSKPNRKRRGVLASRWLVVAVTRSWLSAEGRTDWTISDEYRCLPRRERGRYISSPPQ